MGDKTKELPHTYKSLKMSSRKTAGRRETTKKRATSNVFAMFNQIQEFKEAFNMIDH